MSSKTKTENLGLNQWALDDIYQMSDFNEDNAKIDAAITSARAEADRRTGLPLVRLADITPTENKNNLNIDLAEFDASGKYLEYWIFCPFESLMYLAGSNDMMVFDPDTGNWSDSAGPCRSQDGFFKFRVVNGYPYNYYYITGSRTFLVRPMGVGNSRSLGFRLNNGGSLSGKRFIVLGLEL